jgi:hypothetical protein
VRKSAALAMFVWDNRIAGAGCAATAMIKMVVQMAKYAGQTGCWIGMATTGYLDYSPANARS